MTDTTTRNAQLAELAALAHEFLSLYTGLPDIATVSVQCLRGGLIELHLRDELEAAAVWAREVAVPVHLRLRDSYVEVVVRTTTHGQQVRLWTHIRGVPAWRLLSELGLEMTDAGVDVDPARVLEYVSTQDGA